MVMGMTEKRFGFESFEISKTDKFLDEVKLYEIDKNHSDDLDESNLFYVYSTSEENIIQLVDKLNELAEENKQLQNTIARLQLINDILRDKDYTNYKKKIQELQEENGRLRRCINEIYTIARLEEV